MILPTKGVTPDRALLAVGARILPLLDEPRSVTRAWALFREREAGRGARERVSFAWFTLALDLLYALGLVHMRRGLLVAVRAGEDDDAA